MNLDVPLANPYEEQRRQNVLKVRAALDSIVPKELRSLQPVDRPPKPPKASRSKRSKSAAPAVPVRKSTRSKPAVNYMAGVDGLDLEDDSISELDEQHEQPSSAPKQPSEEPSPTTALERVLVAGTSAEDWDPGEAREVAMTLRQFKVTAGQIRRGVYSQAQLAPMLPLAGQQMKVLEARDSAASASAAAAAASGPAAVHTTKRKRVSLQVHAKSNLVCGELQQAVWPKVASLKDMGFRTLKEAMSDTETCKEVQEWAKQQAKMQTDENARKLKLRKYDERNRTMLSTPFTAEEVLDKLGHAFNNPEPKKKQAVSNVTDKSSAAGGASTEETPAGGDGSADSQTGTDVDGEPAAAASGPAAPAAAGTAARTKKRGRQGARRQAAQQQQEQPQQEQAQVVTPIQTAGSIGSNAPGEGAGAAAAAAAATLQRLQEAALLNPALADALKAAQCLPTGTPGQTPVNHPPCSGATGNSRRQQPSRVRGGAGGSAGTSSRGEAAAPAAELRVGDRVQVLAVNDHVAAVGTVTALTEGFLLSEHPDDAAAKVKRGHAAVGSIEVSDRMEKAAKSVTFWVPQVTIKLQAGNNSCTFWSHREQLKQPGVMVSVPKQRLKLLRCSK